MTGVAATCVDRADVYGPRRTAALRPAEAAALLDDLLRTHPILERTHR